MENMDEKALLYCKSLTRNGYQMAETLISLVGADSAREREFVAMNKRYLTNESGNVVGCR